MQIPEKEAAELNALLTEMAQVIEDKKTRTLMKKFNELLKKQSANAIQMVGWNS